MYDIALLVVVLTTCMLCILSVLLLFIHTMCVILHYWCKLLPFVYWLNGTVCTVVGLSTDMENLIPFIRTVVRVVFGSVCKRMILLKQINV